MHFYTNLVGSGEAQTPLQNPPSIRAINPRPVLSEIQYVLETLPQSEQQCSTRGTSTTPGSSRKTNSDSSFDSLIQMLLDQTKNPRRNRQKPKTRTTAKTTATVRQTGTQRRKRTRRTTRPSRRESPETESSGTSSSEEYSDY
ncbi:ORF2 [Thetatorquevirus ursid4]|uniref:ORF2 n=1 Tax=Giant panda anellovirus TaxID=2016460 RepID=A0A220IGM2_9VIRU|nr:ORF2 [Giant panda anellovirus]ASH99126.1 ORF2 [Giant panda anellovirus]